MKLFYWLLAMPLAVVTVLFAVSNMVVVDIRLWPLPGQQPVWLFIVGLVPLVVGFLAGGTVSWLGAGRTRGRARAAERAVRARDLEIEDLRARIKNAERQAAARKTDPPEQAGLPVPLDAQSG